MKNRELRLFLLAIALPALLVAGGGGRLLVLEAERARASEREALRLRAVALAGAFERAVAERSRLLLAPLAAETNAVARAAAARRIAGAEADVAAILLTGREGREPRRGRRAADGPAPFRRAGPRPGRGPRPGPPGRGFPGGGPERPPASADGAAGPDAGGAPPPPAPATLAFDTTLPSGEACRVRFAEADAFCAAVLRESGDEEGPVAISVRVPDGRLVGSAGSAGERDDAAEAPVARTNVRLRAAWPESVSGSAGARLFRIGGCLLALLVCSLFAGGWMLVRTARRERLDALRKTDFVDNVSHELKTPLAGIRLSAELLSEGRLPEGPRRDRAVRSILAESDRLERLVSNLLDFGRLERGRRRLDVGKVDLGGLLDEMREAERAVPNGGGGAPQPAFLVRQDEPGLVALADPDAVRRILANLLENAAKYAPGAPPEIVVRGAGDGRLALEVADRGPGVPPGLEEKVFERFFRADNATNRRTNGSGIGLSLARGLARGMGGDLACRPRDGGGAVFVLTLPRAGAERH